MPATTTCGRPPISQARSHGVSLIITLLAIILLAFMVAFVFNLGQKATNRVAAQTSADAVAHAGAGWVARSFNCVAMNNVAMSRMIALINVLDSLPMAVDFTYTDPTDTQIGDETAMYLALRHALTLPVSDDVLIREMIKTRDAIGAPPSADDGTVNADQEALRQLDQLFKDQPHLVSDQTHYVTYIGGRGQIWKALAALDGYNQSIIEQMTALAQVAAAEAGHAEVEGFAALLLPTDPTLPIKRGRFNDFQRPVLHGLLPSGTDDKVTNRGPFDTVYGWRWTNSNRGGDYLSDPPGHSPPQSASRYSVYGPQEWMIQRFWGTPQYSRLSFHLRRIAAIKSSYIWPNKRNDASDATLVSLVDPDWEVDLVTDNERSSYPSLPQLITGDQDAVRQRRDSAGVAVTLCDGTQHSGAPCMTAFQYARHHHDDVHETMYMVLDLYHREADTTFPTTQEWPSAGADSSWFVRTNRWRMGPIFLRNGWRSPETRPPLGRMVSNVPPLNAPSTYTALVAPYLYKEVCEFQTNPNVQQGQYQNGAFPRLGLPAVVMGYDTNGAPIYQPQRYFRTRYYLLVGANVGIRMPVSDPYKGFTPTSASAPAPYDLDRTQLPANDAEARRQFLSFLGVGAMGNASPMSSWRFDNNEPLNILAMAQAQVFNNHSWDLWTQMWHAQLEPIDKYSDWVSKMQQANDAYADTWGLTTGQLNSLTQYFQALSGSAQTMASH